MSWIKTSNYLYHLSNFIHDFTTFLLLFFLIQLWASMQVIHLSGDIRLNLGPKRASLGFEQ